MTTVYILWHTREVAPDEDDDRWFGIYSTEDKAKQAIVRLRGKPAFKDYPDGFEIVRYEVDKGEHWTEGFISWAEAMRE